jgi:hypothetical protein
MNALEELVCYGLDRKPVTKGGSASAFETLEATAVRGWQEAMQVDEVQAMRLTGEVRAQDRLGGKGDGARRSSASEARAECRWMERRGGGEPKVPQIGEGGCQAASRVAAPKADTSDVGDVGEWERGRETGGLRV